MTLPQFVLAVLLLLLTPGPTNTLMALGGHARGWSRALPLVGGELFGYLAVIVPVATVAAPFFNAYPQAALAAKAAAVVWVLHLGVRLWFSARRPADAVEEISVRQVFVTTMLNPKALLIALVIMPHGDLAALMHRLVLFSGLVVLAANGWILFGRLMRGNHGVAVRPAVIRRVAAVCMLLFAMILAGSSLQALA
jgi:threonine/homoserine/homoserine lactone efflux protein